MIELFFAAFVMGIFGSFHCIGMCGPLALALPLKSNALIDKFSGVLLYNSGRIVTYSLFGLFFGAVGKSVAIFGFQQWLSIIIGLLVLIFVVLPKRLTAFGHNNFMMLFYEKLRSGLAHLFFKKGSHSLFLIGILNGFFPCGLVYMAAAGSLATGDVVKGIMFMVLFGVGTLPVMWSIAFLGNYVGLELRIKIRRAYPYMMMLMACMLIIRGLGLGIPYLSPKVDLKSKTVHSCCVKQQ